SQRATCARATPRSRPAFPHRGLPGANERLPLAERPARGETATQYRDAHDSPGKGWSVNQEERRQFVRDHRTCVATFETPPRHVYKMSVIDTLTHFTSTSLPW